MTTVTVEPKNTNVEPHVTQITVAITGARGPAGDGRITTNRTYTVAASGADFTTPSEAAAYLQRFRIARGVTVTIDIAAGTYTCTRIVGHIDGAQIVWQTPAHTPLTLANFTITRFLDLDDSAAVLAKLNTDKATNVTAVRAAYPVKLEFASSGAALAACGLHTGVWQAALFINTGSADYGVITGTGDDSSIGDGPGGVAVVPGCCFYGFDNAGGVADYGGVINDAGAVYCYGGESCTRADFAGGFYGEDVMLIGGANYGFRSNHGGYAYRDGGIVRQAGTTGVETTNSPGMAWFHNGDIQECGRFGVNAAWGGSSKFFQATIKNNGTALRASAAQIRAGLEASIDARGVIMVSDVSGLGYGIQAVGGSVDVSVSATISGHTRDADCTGPGGVYVGTDSTIGTMSSGGTLGAAVDSKYWLRHIPLPEERPTTGTITIASGVLNLGSNPPLIVNVASEVGGAPDEITSITYTDLPIGSSVVLKFINTGETITITDSLNLPLLAPSRVLASVRDQITLTRLSASTTGSLVEVAYANNGSNLAYDLSSPGTFGIASPPARATGDVLLHYNTSTKQVTYGETRLPPTVFASLPAAASYTGATVLVTDVGVDGGSVWKSDGSIWSPIGPVMLARSAVQTSSAPGSATETTVQSVTIPAGLMGTNRSLRVDHTWSMTANANAKTFRARLSTASSPPNGTSINSTAAASNTVTTALMGRIANRNSASSQVANGTALSGGVGNSTQAVATGALNSANVSYIVFTVELGTAPYSDTVFLERYQVELLP